MSRATWPELVYDGGVGVRLTSFTVEAKELVVSAVRFELAQGRPVLRRFAGDVKHKPGVLASQIPPAPVEHWSRSWPPHLWPA